MAKILSSKIYIITGLILVFGCTPIVLYWFTAGRYAITPDSAKSALRRTNSNAVLIDIRSYGEFSSKHINGALNWPLEDINKISSKHQLPEHFRDKTLFLICSAGILSNSAVKHLEAVGIGNVKSVRGGMQEWIANSTGSGNCLFEHYNSSDGQYSEFPMRQSPLYEQVAQVVSGYVIKPAYSILAFIIAGILWKRQERDLKALKWSMIFFFAGENFCAINYLFFADQSYLSEYLHSFGMLLAFSFVTYAILEGVDTRILHLSDPDKKCAALGLCKSCIKYDNVPCGLQRTFSMIIPALVIIALMPLFADWQTVSYNTMILGTRYNYSHLIVHQQYERLFCPLAAIILFFVSFLILLFKEVNPVSIAKLFFAGGTGALGFGMMRTMLAGFYSQNLVWSNVWEEVTELLFIIGVCFILWTFRRGLFTTEHQTP